jgi:arylsulfatase A-like enzyme
MPTLRSLTFAAALACIILPSALVLGADPFKAKAEHVVLVVWDGMRPNFITPENTPNLHALAQRGTFFANNHSFYVTTTEVNGTVLATGTFPSHSTIVANREYRPDIDPHGPIATDSAEVIKKGDELTGGRFIATETVPELVRKSGQSVAVAGTKPVAILQDRHPERAETPFSVTVFGGKAYPESYLEKLTSTLGEFPNYKPNLKDPQPNTAGNLWTTRALIENLWKDGTPRYSVLWLSDPDFPQHVTFPGHPAALAGIHNSDTNLGLVIAELEKRGQLDKTDVFVVSDHGFSTIERSADFAEYFAANGVTISRVFKAPPTPGQIISVNVGGSTGLYVIGHDQTVIARLVELLRASDFAGVIFTRDALPGTFPLSVPHLDSPGAADIVFSYRWNPGVNSVGVPGLIVAEGRAGAGTHGTLSKFDIHNTLVAGGPDIRAGYRNELPTGNIDVAPTILHLLGLDAPDRDGRILTEALAATELPTEKPVTTRLEATQKLPGGKTWKQYLQTTTYAGKTYFDEGNVVPEP